MYRRSYNAPTYRSGAYGGSNTSRDGGYGGGHHGYGGGYRPSWYRRHIYGPMLRHPWLFGRGSLWRRRRDRPFRYWYSPENLNREEHRDDERRREEDNMRISEDEARKAKTLTVSHLELHLENNTDAHHTNEYHCVAAAEPKQLVLRRGQEFMLTVTFDRRFQTEKDNLEFIFSPDDGDDSDDDRGRRPGEKSLDAAFQLDEERSGAFSPDHKGWAARILSSNGPRMTVEVHIPPDCVVGEWDLTIRTQLQGEADAEDFEYEYPQPFIILFNPWSRGDQVFFTDDQRLLDEYVMNEDGLVFRGGRGSPWIYGQFQENILNICLLLLRKAFGFKVTAKMGDAVLVSRALSRIVNSADDNGVVMGNWSGDYGRETRPTAWKNSTDILRKFYNTRKPVKYGQCWVFSHVLTAVCRALGLPCRSVTNFDSAHDTNNTCTIDFFFDEDGDVYENPECNDSIWNFHVWNEVWMQRPDLKEGDFNGWQVIDATPQEMSGRMYQCGPCPIKAVLRGEVDVGYDTAFVFSEVNADVIYWVKRPGRRDELQKRDETRVGTSVLTKNPYEERAMDITSLYKYPEGSRRERRAVAAAEGMHFEDTTVSQDLEVSFRRDTVVGKVGKDFELTLVVSNVSSEVKHIMVTMTARAARYWDHGHRTRKLAKRKPQQTAIRPGATEYYILPVTVHQYMGVLDDQWTIGGYALVKDMVNDRSYNAENTFNLEVPALDVKGPATARSEQPVTVTVTFMNPLPIPLKNCSFSLSGSLDVAPDDTHPWSKQDGAYKMNFRRDSVVRASERVMLTVRLVGKWARAERRQTKSMTIAFDCDELGSMDGSYRLMKAP